ncbi:MAG: ABC transporter permease [Chloroflexota bacterium]
MSSAVGATSAPIAEPAPARETETVTTSVRRRSWWPLAGLILPLALVVLWQVGAESGAIKTQIASTPGQVVATLWTLLTNGVLAKEFVSTVTRIAFGFAIGLGLGLGLGILTGWIRVADRLIDPSLRALNAVPAVGWIPFLILWLGIGDISKIALISLATFFPIYANTYAGIRSTDQKLIELALAYRLPRRTIVSRIVIPSAVPQILVGVRVAIAVTWVVGTVSEILYGNNGLGVLLNDGRSLARPDQMVALLIVLAVLGKASDAVVVRLQRRLTSWQSNLDSMPAYKARVIAAREPQA